MNFTHCMSCFRKVDKNRGALDSYDRAQAGDKRVSEQ